MKKFDILTFGSITFDIFIPLDKNIPILEDTSGDKSLQIPLGEKIPVKTSVIQCGGGSANTAIGFSKLGFSVAAFGEMGDQSYRGFLLHTLEEYNISTEYITFVKNQTSSFSVILSAYEGERTVFNKRLETQKFDHAVLEAAPQSKAIYVSHLYSNDFLEFLPKWKEKNPETLIFWNPGKTQFREGFEHFLSLYPQIDCLFINCEEAEQFSGILSVYLPRKSGTSEILGQAISGAYPPFRSNHIHDVRKIAKKFLTAGVKKVIITDGSKGAQMFSASGHFFAPSVDVRVVDTLGAGDAFAVGVASAQIYEEDEKTQLIWGSLNSGSVIQKLGAQPGQLTLETLNSLI